MALLLTYLIEMLPVQFWKKKKSNQTNRPSWWTLHKKNENQNLIPANNVIVTQTNEKKTWFTFLIPILPWQFCTWKNKAKFVREKKAFKLLLHHITFWLATILLLHTTNTHVKFSIFYTTEWILKMMSIFNQLVLDTKINVQHHHWKNNKQFVQYEQSTYLG